MNPSADHAESKSCFCIVRKTISSLSSNTRWTTFPFDSQRTAVLNRRASWGASISWQFLEKACDKSRPFYKVICLYKDIQCPVILKVVFDARACLWIIQWVGIVLGAFSVTCDKTWLRTQHGWSSICVYPRDCPSQDFQFQRILQFTDLHVHLLLIAQEVHKIRILPSDPYEHTLQKPGVVCRAGCQ